MPGSVAASFPQRARANYRQRYIGQNLKAETYRFRGGPIHRKRGGRFIVDKSDDQQACQQPENPRRHRTTRQRGGRFIVVTRRPPRSRRLSPRHRPGVGDITSRAAREGGADSACTNTRRGGCKAAPGWRKARAVCRVVACGQSRGDRARRREPGRASRFSRTRKSPKGLGLDGDKRELARCAGCHQVPL